MQTNLQAVAAAKERPVITAQGRETVWSESRTDPVEEKEMEVPFPSLGPSEELLLVK